MCVRGGGGFKLLEPVGMEGEKGRKNISLSITKCHLGDFQKLFKKTFLYTFFVWAGSS